MVKYIDAERAKRIIAEAVDNGLATTSSDLVDIINDLPAANVEPLRHGQWQRLDNIRKHRYCCCICRGVSNVKSQYCPNCGAKMEVRYEE